MRHLGYFDMQRTWGAVMQARSNTNHVPAGTVAQEFSREAYVFLPGDLVFHEAGVEEHAGVVVDAAVPFYVSIRNPIPARVVRSGVPHVAYEQKSISRGGCVGLDDALKVYQHGRDWMFSMQVSQIREAFLRAKMSARCDAKSYFLDEVVGQHGHFTLNPVPVVNKYGTVILDEKKQPIVIHREELHDGWEDGLGYKLGSQFYDYVIDRVQARVEGNSAHDDADVAHYDSGDDEDDNDVHTGSEAARTVAVAVVSTTSRGRQARNTYGATSYRELANMAPVRVSSRLGKASSRVIGSDGNYDTCGRCKRKGNRGEELVCCDGCEEAFHMRCLPDDAPEVSPGDSKWFCLTTLPCREAHARTE